VYHHEHYSANKERYITQARERKRALAIERTEWLLTYFDSHPCCDCGDANCRRRRTAKRLGSVRSVMAATREKARRAGGGSRTRL
jgi:hypothetical protein